MTEAPLYPLPRQKFVSLEYPGPVRSYDAALRTLSPNPLPMNMEKIYYSMSDDRFAHPITGEKVITANFVLKLTRRRKRKRVTLQVVDEGSFKARIIGGISSTTRFRNLADFQFSPREDWYATPLGQLNNALHEFDLDFIKSYKFCSLEEDYAARKDHIYLPPPPVFTRSTIPSIYNYRPNPSSVLDPGGRLINKHRQKGLYSVYIRFEEPNVPSQPPEHVLSEASVIPPELMAAWDKIWEDRPIWTKLSILESLGMDDRAARTWKQLFPLKCYAFTSGPWADCLCRLGYDPRKDPNAKQYQRLYFRLPVALRDSAKLSEPKDGETSFGFDGIKIFRHHISLQVCDITDKFLLSILEDTSTRTECSERDGWFHGLQIEMLRSLIKFKFIAISQEITLTELECQNFSEATRSRYERGENSFHSGQIIAQIQLGRSKTGEGKSLDEIAERLERELQSRG